ncbi:MAG: DUF4328 domain-containing protein [Verrucomicrobiaceae bacterium]|nr:MAG: DUF4328 domain-containing protein [Verrucomicrobiaceae bacterium]
MSKIHVATREGQSEHEEAELRTLWHQGQLPRDAKYWKEGMADWQPLASWFSNDGAPFNPYSSTLHAEPQAVSASGNYAYVRSPHSLTRFLLVMLSLCVVCSTLNILSDGMQLSLLNSSYTQEEGEANDLRQSILAISWTVLFFVTSIPFLRWIHRANLNLRGFGAWDLKFTPGWAVGYFFIPFINLVRPYQAMKEIWQASHDPKNWQLQKNTALVGWWWALWILCSLMGRISLSFSRRADTIDKLNESTAISIVSSSTNLVVTLLAILLVLRISRKQEERVNGNAALSQFPPAGI